MIHTVKRSVKNELKRNQRISQLLDKNGNADIAGFIERKKVGKHAYYYLSTDKGGKRTRTYLGKENSQDLLKVLQIIYQRTFKEILDHNRPILEQTMTDLWDDSVEGVYARMPKLCREICKTGFVDQRMEELKAWAAADYPRNPQEFRDAENYAIDGTRLRSKGEVIWYNLLLAAGIPFRYECLLIVTDDWGNERNLYPDFMIQCYDGSIIIIEHLGGLALESYRLDFGTRARLYQKEGYVLGDNFTKPDQTKQTGNPGAPRRNCPMIFSIIPLPIDFICDPVDNGLCHHLLAHQFAAFYSLRTDDGHLVGVRLEAGPCIYQTIGDDHIQVLLL